MNTIDMNRVCRKDISISLSPEEKELFSTLLKANSELHLNSTLRVAGGWVRDKILGMHSHDIDIAIDNMTGYEFVKHLPMWLSNQGYNTSNIGKIKANPDKSKHLETATIRINNQDIDFVNLRKEEYTDESRIPTVSIGTPAEDAYRRDLTINSIFYNINTNTIEDFTMQGVEDLHHRIARTPLPALETFHEDPLRILRTIRFATRYECTITDDIMNASKDPDIELFLSRKVSRERIGVEFLKMAQSRHFLRAVKLIEEMNILHTIFNIEGDNSNYMKNQKQRTLEEFNNSLFLITMPKESVISLNSLSAKFMNPYFETIPCNNPQFTVKETEEDKTIMNGSHRYFSFMHERLLKGIKTLKINEELMCNSQVHAIWNQFGIYDLIQPIEEGWEAVLRLACLLNFFSHSFLCGEMYFTHRKKTTVLPQVLSPLIKHFIRESLKLKNSVIDNVCWIVHQQHEFLPIFDKLRENSNYSLTNDDIICIGNLIFHSKELWPLMLHLAVVNEIYENEDKQAEILQIYAQLLYCIQEKELMNLWTIPSIIDGNALCQYGVKKGPGMKKVMDDIRNWMFLHPHGTKEECVNDVINSTL